MALSPAVVGAIAGAVAGGATTVLFQSLLRWGRRGIAWMRNRVLPDHLTLHAGPWQYHLPPDGGPSDVRVLVICAPSRSLRRPAVDVDRAIAFVHAHFAGHFPADPTFSNIQDGVRFTNPTQSGMDNGHALVAANGRLDLSLPVPVASGGDGCRRLEVVALLKPIAAMARAAADPHYRHVFRVRRTIRARRFDWCIGISTTSHGSTGTQLAWHDLTFPGVPARRATEQRPFCPANGYASREMRNRRANGSVEELLRRFLVSFFECNGYHDFYVAVNDVLAAWRRDDA